MKVDIAKIIELRKEIHKNPELSGNEFQTVKRIKHFFKENDIDAELYEIEETSIIAIINGEQKGDIIAFRADIDAVSVKETNTFEHKSVNIGISHACGHDGHLASNAAIALMLKVTKLKKGRVMIIFQSAAETGEGAKKIITSQVYNKNKPLYVFAFRNLPGFSLNKVILVKEIFAMASVGLRVELEGSSFHTAYIKDNLCPAKPMNEIIDKILYLPQQEGAFHDYVFSSVNYINYGKPTYNISPNKAIMQFTLRSDTTKTLDKLNYNANRIVVDVLEKHGQVKSESRNEEYFPATLNTPYAINLISNACDMQLLEKLYRSEAFKWSEDFAYYHSNSEQSAIFGIGSGSNHDKLHTSGYDFPDQIIETYLIIVENILAQLGMI